MCETIGAGGVRVDVGDEGGAHGVVVMEGEMEMRPGAGTWSMEHGA